MWKGSWLKFHKDTNFQVSQFHLADETPVFSSDLLHTVAHPWSAPSGYLEHLWTGLGKPDKTKKKNGWKRIIWKTISTSRTNFFRNCIPFQLDFKALTGWKLFSVILVKERDRERALNLTTGSSPSPLLSCVWAVWSELGPDSHCSNVLPELTECVSRASCCGCWSAAASDPLHLSDRKKIIQTKNHNKVLLIMALH